MSSGRQVDCIVDKKIERDTFYTVVLNQTQSRDLLHQKRIKNRVRSSNWTTINLFWKQKKVLVK